MDEKKWLYDFRVAYKRLKNQYKEDTEQYFNSVVWLGKLSKFRLKQIIDIKKIKKHLEGNKDKDDYEYEYEEENEEDLKILLQEKTIALTSTFEMIRYFHKISFNKLTHRIEAELNGSLIAGKEDLLNIQQFDQTYKKKVKNKDGKIIEVPIPPTGYNAVQLIGARKRILIAKLNETPFLLFVNKSAIELQKLLSNNGFSDLIYFDGGGAIYFATSQNVIENIGNVSPSGFAVKVNKRYE